MRTDDPPRPVEQPEDMGDMSDSGSCLPQLAEPLQHWSEMCKKSCVFTEKTELDVELRTIIHDMVHNHDKFVQSRLTALQFWKERARALEPELEAFRATLPCHLSCTVGRLHLPLLKEMLEASNHGDKGLLDDLIHGFTVAGEMDAGGLGKSQDGGIKRGGKPAHGVVPCMVSFKARCLELNKRTVARARVNEHAEAIWRKTLQEAEQGVIMNLRPLHEVDLSEVLLTERFGVVQPTAEGGSKVRPIDNYRANGANDQTVCWETTENDREDKITACILELQEQLAMVQPEERVLIGLEDFVGACRTLAPDQHQRWLMQLLVFDTDNHRWVVGELTAMPFGLLGA